MLCFHIVIPHVLPLGSTIGVEFSKGHDNLQLQKNDMYRNVRLYNAEFDGCGCIFQMYGGPEKHDKICHLVYTQQGNICNRIEFHIDCATPERFDDTASRSCIDCYLTLSPVLEAF